MYTYCSPWSMAPLLHRRRSRRQSRSRKSRLHLLFQGHLNMGVSFRFRDGKAHKDIPCDTREMRGELTRTGVWVYNGNSFFASFVLEEALFGAVISSAGETGQVEKDWDLGLRGLRR